jgi:hypothetical protein
VTALPAAARLAALYALVRPTSKQRELRNVRHAKKAATNWVQTDHQAAHKADPGPAGHLALARHVASYVGTQAAVVAVGARVFGIRLTPGRAAAALAVSAVSHYVADRRTPLRNAADALARAVGERDGSAFVRLADHGLNGAYALDQSWHHAFELLAVGILATGPAARD